MGFFNVRAKRILLVLLLVTVIGFTARLWLPDLLKFLSVNGDLIQAIDSGSNLISTLFVVISAVAGYIMLRDRKETAKTPDKLYRRLMLDHVENFWIKGVLEKSLNGVALLELGIKEDPNVVNYPWAVKKETTKEILPAGKSMLEIFEEIGMGRALLILGSPGSGKTTMLLELTRQLIECARKDEAESVPVVFNLASWNGQTMADWLAEQLNLIYSIHPKAAPSWVQTDKMLLLLDGLDEVQEDRRAKCINAINEFRIEHGPTSLVVCCRIEEYWMNKTKLAFEGAITLQPLTSKQIEDYIDRFGNTLASLRLSFRQDPIMQELAETPLMLSIMAIAYKDVRPEALLLSGKMKDQQAHLFDTYIHSMFGRWTRSANILFTKEQTLRYLGWLARTMIRLNITLYQIESMQPDWLVDKAQRQLYGVFIGVTGGFLGWLIFGLIMGSIFELARGRNRELFSEMAFGLRAGLFLGLFLGVFIGLGVWWSSNQRNSIIMTDKLKWSWREAGKGIIMGLLISLVWVFFWGLVFLLLDGPEAALEIVKLFDIPFALILAPTFGLIWGLTPKQVEESTYPGQRIKQTFANAMFSTLIVGLLFWLVGGLFGVRVGRPVFWSVEGLLLGLLFGLAIGLADVPYFRQSWYLRPNGNFLPIIQHLSLRWVLVSGNFLPRQLVPFLEYCVSLIFLRRVGGSYIFVHRLLMEHFAEMDI